MKFRWGLCVAILAVSEIGAATIDVSAETSVVVHTGDTLAFQLLTWNYGVNAAAFGLPVYPTDVHFALASAPLSVAGGFGATLESADRSVSVAFDSLTFGPGYFNGSEYAGVVSAFQGYLHLSPLLAEVLFSAPSAVVALRNDGPDVTIGLPPYLLRQNLFVCLSGGPLSVGAIPGWVELEGQTNNARLAGFGGPLNFAADAEVPEPETGGLLLGGGVLLCVFSVVLARVSRGRK